MKIYLLVLAATILFAVTAGLYLRSIKKKKATINELSQIPKPQIPPPVQQVLPTRIVIGEHADHPVISIQRSESPSTYLTGKPIDIASAPISRLNSLLQAIPSLLTAGEAAGKHLMEVTINGNLVRAADGNGFRAFTMAENRIRENAHLFEVGNLQNMINATAIWQIASVVVAQKHLADISRKLDEIIGGISGISMFLDDQRKSRIEATYAYLGQAIQAIQAGELSTNIRDQLENCERELLEIQIHLGKEYRRMLDKQVEHKEMFGTGDLASGIERKISVLNELARDMTLCIRTRIAAWHVFALYPGEPQLKMARKISIQQSIDSIQDLSPSLSNQINSEISNIKAIFNFSSTLEERQKNLKTTLNLSKQELANQYHSGNDEINNTSKLMLQHDEPSRLLFQFEDGILIGVREAN